MKFITIAAVLSLTTPALLQSTSLTDRSQDTYPLTYDTLYDWLDTPLTSVACSNGQYGLMIRGINTFEQIPTYPAIGGIPMINAWHSPNCGTCWNLTYTDVYGNSLDALFAAINYGINNPDGFTISKATMDYLTNGNSVALDGTTIHVVQMLGSNCGP